MFLQLPASASLDDGDAVSMNVDNRRSRRSVNNVTQLRDLLEELFSVDPDFALTLQGPPVSHMQTC